MPRLFWKTFNYYTEWKNCITSIVNVDWFKIYFEDVLIISEPMEGYWYNRVFEVADEFVRKNFFIWYDDCKDLTLPKTVDRKGKTKKPLPTIDDMYKEIEEEYAE